LKILFLLLFVPLFCLAQPHGKRKHEFIPKISPFTITLIPDSAESNKLYFSYKIPFDKLVFQKGNNHFETSLRVTIEILDSTENLIRREIDQKKIVAENFDDTRNKNLFVQGFIKSNVSENNFIIHPILRDMNAEGEVSFPPSKINVSDHFKNSVCEPFIVNSKMINCGDYDYYQFTNSDNSVPFSNNFYNMIIPVEDTTVEYLDVSLINSSDTVFNDRIYKFELGNLVPEICSNQIILKNIEPGVHQNYFIIKNINENLVEGNLTLEIKKEDDPKVIKFEIPVVWIDKPLSLRNPEFAIESLKFVENDSTISKMLDADEENYPGELLNYWKKFDPTPNTSFNEIMAEYYERIDYAADEFKGLGRETGINTDRSKIYIRYGKPDEVKRNSNSDGNMMEQWVYKNPERIFVFVDKRGTGNFTLVE
jgi:GWxTD domain-containing protein